MGKEDEDELYEPIVDPENYVGKIVQDQGDDLEDDDA